MWKVQPSSIHTYKFINTQHMNTCTIFIMLLIVLIQGSILFVCLFVFFPNGQLQSNLYKIPAKRPASIEVNQKNNHFQAKTVI